MKMLSSYEVKTYEELFGHSVVMCNSNDADDALTKSLLDADADSKRISKAIESETRLQEKNTMSLTHSEKQIESQISYEPQNNTKPVIKRTSTRRLSEYELALKLMESFDISLYFEALMIRDLEGVYQGLTPIGVAQALQNILSFEDLTRITSKDCEGVFTRLRSIAQDDEVKLEVPERAAVFENGAFDIVAEKEYSLRKKDLILSKIHCSYLPYAEFETPYFDKFLKDFSGGDESVQRLLMTFIGYSLLPNHAAKYFWVLGTARDSGKSLISNFIQRLLDSSVISAIPTQDFAKDFVKAQLVGKMLNLAMDIPAGKISKQAVSELKSLTGGDPVTINPKYIMPFRYLNTSKFVFGSNFPLEIDNEDEAFWQRVVIIPFIHSVPKRKHDPKLLEKFWIERDGIVNKAMREVRKFIKSGYILPTCPLSENMRAAWANDFSKDIVDFVENHCCFYDDIFTPSLELYDSFKILFPNTHLSMKSFILRLCSKYGFLQQRRKVNGVQSRGVVGISLKEGDFILDRPFYQLK